MAKKLLLLASLFLVSNFAVADTAPNIDDLIDSFIIGIITG